MNLRVSTVNINRNFFNNLFKLKHSNNVIKNITKPNVIESLPIVAIPLVAYNESSTSRNNLAKNLAKEAISKTSDNTTNTPISDRTIRNLDALKKAGVPERERMKYINSNGYMDSEGKEICRNNNVTSFKGDPEDIDAHESTLDGEITGEPPQIYDIDSGLSDLDSESREMLEEINNTDLSLPPDLQEIIDMPSIDTPDGFLDTIFGGLPDGMSVAGDVWSMLKDIANDILDVGDWF